MSIHERPTPKGVRFDVRYRDAAGVNKSKTFSLRRDAEAFEAQIVLAKYRGGDLPQRRHPVTLDLFVQRWWDQTVRHELAVSTQRVYRAMLLKHISPRLGSTQLRAIDVAAVQAFKASLLEGGVGQQATRKALAVLGTVMQAAVACGELELNPVRAVKLPPARRERFVRPPAPSTVEELRLNLLQAQRRKQKSRLADAALISLMAYAGLRPGEALALQWSDIGTKTIQVEDALTLGEDRIGPTKTRQKRTVTMIGPVRDDLIALKTAHGTQVGLVFPGHDGKPWSDPTYRNWRARVFKPATKNLHWEGRVYDLRHAFVSLRLRAGDDRLKVAQQAGHGVEVMERVYSHVLAELDGIGPIEVEAVVYEARRCAFDRRSIRTGGRTLRTTDEAA